jgi:hypothetical protein
MEEQKDRCLTSCMDFVEFKEDNFLDCVITSDD